MARDKVCVVIGAGDATGGAIARRFARGGYTAVVTRRVEATERLRVYTARYMLIVRGRERGRARVEVEEVALSPAEVLEQVMQATADRTGDPEPPAQLDRSVWFP